PRSRLRPVSGRGAKRTRGLQALDQTRRQRPRWAQSCGDPRARCACRNGLLSPALQQERMNLIHDAVRVLKAKGAAVYIDAGHARWIDAATMADRLTRAGIADANGLSLNISNFLGTSVNVAYGTEVSKRVGGKHFIIDTSRNGQNASSAGNWCNPTGQRLGPTPTTHTGNPLVDAYLWVKTPGESDGTCGGGPAAGRWW